MPSYLPVDKLTEREIEVLCLVADGLTNAAIAKELHVTVHAIKWHTRHIYQKLHVKRRTEAVAVARSLGILQSEETNFDPLKTLSVFRHNLKFQLTSFVGREREIASLHQLILENHLVTLKGLGGVGKTRLANQAAAELLDAFEDGIWFIDLAPINDPALVLQLVLNTLGLRVELRQIPVNTLTDFLLSKKSLLIFDNCEHLADATAELVEMLLQTCEKLSVLATSRESLRVSSEVIFDLYPLPTPKPDQSLSVEEVSQFDATRLFIERAKNVLPEFSLSDEDIKPLIQVCHLLDGIPLAIELAVAWLNMLSLKQISEKLENSLHLLTNTRRTALPRQQTMYALIDWSYNLLGESEKKLLNRVSVFASDWNLESAEEICSGSGIEETEILPLLSQLISKSLVVQIQEGSLDSRYRLLKTIQQFGFEKLMETGEDEVIYTQYLAYFQKLSNLIEANLRGKDFHKWLNTASLEHDNFHFALELCQKNHHFKQTGLRIAGNLAWYWFARGHLKEGHYRLEKITDGVQDVEDQATYVKVLWGTALLSAMMGDLVEAEELLAKSLEFAEEIDQMELIANIYLTSELIGYLKREKSDVVLQNLKKALLLSEEINYKWGIGEAYHILGHYYTLEDDLSLAEINFEKSVQTMRELGDEFSLSHPLNDLGRIARRQKKYQKAISLFEESKNISKKLDSSWGMALTLGELGKVAFLQKEFASAIDYLNESILIAHDLGDKIRIAGSLAFLGLSYEAIEEIEKFAKIQGMFDTFMKKHQLAFSPVDEELYYELFSTARADITNETYNTYWNEGCSLTIEQVLELANH